MPRRCYAARRHCLPLPPTRHAAAAALDIVTAMILLLITLNTNKAKALLLLIDMFTNTCFDMLMLPLTLYGRLILPFTLRRRYAYFFIRYALL